MMLATVLNENGGNKVGLLDIPGPVDTANGSDDTISRPPSSVHITNYYHEHSGGVKSNYDKLLRAADRHRRYISVIVPGAESRVEKIGQYGKLYFVAAKPAPFIDRRYRVIMPSQYLFHGSAIREILLKEKADIVEIYDNSSLIFLAGMTRMGYFAGLGRPMFVYFTGERFDTIFKTFVVGGRLGGWFSRRALANFNLPMFDCYIANSTFVADELLVSDRKSNNPRRWEWFNNLCRRIFRSLPEPVEDRLAICPRGVDAEQYSPERRSTKVRSKICRDADIPDTATIIVSATRLSPEKNVRLLISIMERLAADQEHDFRLLIAGSGPESQWLSDESRRFNGKMCMLGQLEKSQLAELYANADVFVHPNPREPFGNVGLEAMASGAACVFPNSGGVLTYADHSNAWLVEPNPASFYGAIKEAIEDEPLRQSKVRNAMETAARYGDDAAIDRLLETYDRFFRSFSKRQIVEDRRVGDPGLNGRELQRRT